MTATGSWPFREHGISPAESRVLVLLSSGLGNQQIADQLSVGIETVRSHLKQVYRALGVHTRSEAMVWAYDTGELPAVSDERSNEEPEPSANVRIDSVEDGDEQTDQTESAEHREHSLQGREPPFPFAFQDTEGRPGHSDASGEVVL
jgi:DNA-binding CsgD family transcriptional regulator